MIYKLIIKGYNNVPRDFIHFALLINNFNFLLRDIISFLT